MLLNSEVKRQVVIVVSLKALSIVICVPMVSRNRSGNVAYLMYGVTVKFTSCFDLASLLTLQT